MPSFQQRTAPIQQYIAQYDNGRKQGQMNGMMPSPFRTPENRNGYGQWGQMTPYKMPSAPNVNADDDSPWLRDPRMMQWLMSMFGGASRY